MTENTVDLCFVLDCTSSMERYITMTKDNITQTVERVSQEVPEVEINYGFVCYRDWCDGDQRIERFPFNKSLTRFKSFVGRLEAKGGGDTPEDVLGGLWEAANMTWTSDTRVVFHIFDAPPHKTPLYHNCDDSYPDGHPMDHSLSEIFGKFMYKEIDYYMCPLGPEFLRQMITVFQAEAAETGYRSIHERSEIDVSKIMRDVGEAVLHSMAIRLSRRGRRNRESNLRFQPRLKQNSYSVYCAIDFGTHGSAYAFCTPSDPHARVEQTWEGSHGDVKTLTNLLLGPNKKLIDGPNAFGHAALDWYMNMDEDDQKECYFFRRFKMALYEDAVRAEEREEKTDIVRSVADVNGKRISSMIVLREALEFMVTHIMTQIEERYDVSDINDVQWIVTVPAIWSLQSRVMMERAAYKAGIPKRGDNLKIALEPECASIVVNSHPELGLTAGDAYMLVDCGGGTVDIACHELHTNTSVGELYMASGGPWGSTYIDDAFIAFLSHIFGEDVLTSPDVDMCELIQRFGGSKEKATMTEESRNVEIDCLVDVLEDKFGSVQDVNAHVSTIEYRGVKGGISYRKGKLVLSRGIWDVLFRTVLDPMIAHVRDLLSCKYPELNERIKTICLVGGFAQSDILLQRFVNEFGDERRVLRPENPILAVVHGAAKYGLIPELISGRKARSSIGIAVRDAWKEGDGDERKIWDSAQHTDCVDDVFFPFVKKGNPVPTDMPPIEHWFEPLHRDKFIVKIYECTDDVPPRFISNEACAQIGPVEYPPDYRTKDQDILVRFDISGVTVKVTVKFGDLEPVSVDLNWEG